MHSATASEVPPFLTLEVHDTVQYTVCSPVDDPSDPVLHSESCIASQRLVVSWYRTNG